MKVFYFLSCLSLLIACNKGKHHDDKHEHPKFDIEVVKKTIHEANQVYANRFFKKDTAWYAERYCKDAVVMPDRMPAITGLAAIAKYYYNDGKNEPGFKLNITENNVFGARKAVIETGVYDMPDGKGGFFDKGKFIAIWQEEGAKWKISHEIWNSDITPVPEK